MPQRLDRVRLAPTSPRVSIVTLTTPLVIFSRFRAEGSNFDFYSRILFQAIYALTAMQVSFICFAGGAPPSRRPTHTTGRCPRRSHPSGVRLGPVGGAVCVPRLQSLATKFF